MRDMALLVNDESAHHLSSPVASTNLLLLTVFLFFPSSNKCLLALQIETSLIAIRWPKFICRPVDPVRMGKSMETTRC